MTTDTNNKEKFTLEALVAESHRGSRLDQVAADLFPDFSRARLQQWIKEGCLTVNGRQAKPKDKVMGGERLDLIAEIEAESGHEAEAISLDIIYEDDDLLVINKPAGLVVHPGAGNRTGTLLNALLHHDPGLEQIPRAGIVHRLDKETTGLMVVARTLKAHQDLVEQLRLREVRREYLAIVCGVVTAGGTVDAPLGRHPVQRKKRAVSEAQDARPAVTHYRVEQKFRSHTLLSCSLETGRTHQIRVHMAHIGFPLLGDPTYGGRLKLPRGASPSLISAIQQFKRQALHAWRLGLVHPETLDDMEWEVPLPDDMNSLLEVLAEDSAG
jgi:23S rRNA pseudouridine1911/1915/1917 synthase